MVPFNSTEVHRRYNGPVGQSEAKKFGFFEKYIYIYTYCLSFTKHILLNRCSSNYQYITKIKVKTFVFILIFLCIFVLSVYLCGFSFISIYLHITAIPCWQLQTEKFQVAIIIEVYTSL